MQHDISPTIAKLRTFPRNPKPIVGSKSVKLTRALAERFCDLVAKADDSIYTIIENDPSLPTYKRLDNWQQRVPWFKEMWKQARIRQTHFLAQQSLKLYKEATPKTAHVARVRFDIIRWLCAKFNPDFYGDKPAQLPNTTVNVGISISPERLQDIRNKLDSTRLHLVKNGEKNGEKIDDKSESLTIKEQSHT